MTDREIYLQSLQSTISRLSGQSFIIKGWAVTVASGFLGLAITQKSSLVMAAAIFPLVLFWLLDAYYLTLERRFRSLYNIGFKEVDLSKNCMHFDHAASGEGRKTLHAAMSKPVLLLYLAVMIMDLVGARLLAH